MTKEQENAVKYFRRRIDICIENINICDENDFDEEATRLREEQKHTETVLSTIEKLRNNNKDLLRKLKNRVKEVRKLTKYSLYKNELKILNKQLEKKNKIIDKMAEYLASIDFDQHCAEVPDICMGCPKEDDLDGYMQCIKYYFERKVEGE